MRANPTCTRIFLQDIWAEFPLLSQCCIHLCRHVSHNTNSRCPGILLSFCVRHFSYEIRNLLTLLRRYDHLQFGGNRSAWHLQGTPTACAVLERRRSIHCRTLKTMPTRSPLERRRSIPCRTSRTTPTLSHSVLCHVHLHTCVT